MDLLPGTFYPTVELQWLELWLLIYLAWLELSSWSLQGIFSTIHPGWVELPLARTIFHGPKPVWAIEVLLALLVFMGCYHIWIRNDQNSIGYDISDWITYRITKQGVWGHSPHNSTARTLNFSLMSKTVPGKAEAHLDLHAPLGDHQSKYGLEGRGVWAGGILKAIDIISPLITCQHV